MSQRRRRFRLKAPAILIIIVAVLAVCAVFFVVHQNKGGTYKELPFTSALTYHCTETGYLYIEGSYVNYYDLSDTDYNYRAALPKEDDLHLAGMGRKLHVVYNSRYMCIVGLKDALPIEGTIDDVKCGYDHTAVLTHDGDTSVITVFDKDGKECDRIIQDDKIAEFDFAHTTKDIMYVVTLNTDSGVTVSTITSYAPDIPAVTGVISLQGQLIENIVYTSKSIYVKGTTNMIRYDVSDNRESYRLLTHGYHMGDCSHTDNKTIFMMYDNDGSENSVKMYITEQRSVASEKVLPLQIPENAIGVFAGENCAYIFTDTQIQVYGEKAQLVRTFTLKHTASEVIKIDDHNYLIQSSGKLFTIKIK